MMSNRPRVYFTALFAVACTSSHAEDSSSWSKTQHIERDGAEADLLVRTGDIDNLGFGWPQGFDPFTGRSTPEHAFPWEPGEADPPGTDRIMVIGGWKTADGDGYTSGTARPANAVQPLGFRFDPEGLQVRAAALQLFVDDFQAPVWGHRYRVTLDGRDAPDLAYALNALNQTGPIGKLVTLQLLPEYLPLLEDGRLDIVVDDPERDAAEGFAFDYGRLLINPKPWRYTGKVRGIAVRAADGEPLAGVLVSVGNVRQMTTTADGRFELSGVPAGLVVTRGSHPDYLPDTEALDLEVDAQLDVRLELEQVPDSGDSLAAQLDREGRVDLYGIYFDTDQATLKPESEATLKQVQALLDSRPALRLAIGGHTDAEGDDDHNHSLSERRAASVVTWLVAQGVDAARLQAEGFGEARPVAANDRPEGRALNRRVEIRDATP